jgi:hypothetical protein
MARLATAMMLGLLFAASGTTLRVLAPRLSAPTNSVLVLAADRPYTESGRREAMMNDGSLVLTAAGMLLIVLAVHSWTLPRDRDG